MSFGAGGVVLLDLVDFDAGFLQLLGGFFLRHAHNVGDFEGGGDLDHHFGTARHFGTRRGEDTKHVVFRGGGDEAFIDTRDFQSCTLERRLGG